MPPSPTPTLDSLCLVPHHFPIKKPRKSTLLLRIISVSRTVENPLLIYRRLAYRRCRSTSLRGACLRVAAPCMSCMCPARGQSRCHGIPANTTHHRHSVERNAPGRESARICRKPRLRNSRALQEVCNFALWLGACTHENWNYTQHHRPVSCTCRVPRFGFCGIFVSSGCT